MLKGTRPEKAFADETSPERLGLVWLTARSLQYQIRPDRHRLGRKQINASCRRRRLVQPQAAAELLDGA